MSVYQSYVPEEATDEFREQFEVTPTGDFGVDSMRARFKIQCRKCGSVLHPNTTWPPSYADLHKCVNATMFQIPEEMKAEIAQWQNNQVEQMKQNNNGGMPYLGASGGLWSYMFTPTSIGMAIKVINNFNQEELSLFDD